MADFIPERRRDITSDDIQDIERDMQKLAIKYLRDIDAIRSIARPIVKTKSNTDECVYDVDWDESRPMESRVHAFYRYIGFPVAVKSGPNFYNPGFNPTGGLKKTFRSDINQKFRNADIKTTLIDQREEEFKNNRSLFARRDMSATLYALLLSQEPRPFSVLADGIDALDIDKQEFHVKDRKEMVENFLSLNDLESSEIAPLSDLKSGDFTKVVHLLKPFVVDPAIDCTAMPVRNRIAVPFLKNKDELKINDTTYALRPGIELIIRERLRASESVDEVFLETVRQILNNEVSPNTFLNTEAGTLEGQQLISTVSALLGKYEKDIEDSDVNELGDITRIQTEVISQLVKTLKSMMDVLYKSIQKVLESSDTINWAPVPNVEGPEFGAKNALLRTLKMSSVESEIDKNIILLKLDKIAAEHQRTAREDIGDYASPFNVTTNDKNLEEIVNNLRDAEQKRDKIANDAFVAMGNIELIMGEASGLGLVDVIAIYIALWSMDEKSLISMLDNDAFTRLTTNFSTLVVGAAQDRKTKGEPEIDIVTALGNFESKLKNVFKFADIEFRRKSIQSGQEAGGDIYPDE